MKLSVLSQSILAVSVLLGFSGYFGFSFLPAANALPEASAASPRTQAPSVPTGSDADAKKTEMLKELCALLEVGENAVSMMDVSFAEQEKQVPVIMDAMLAQKAQDIPADRLAPLKEKMIEAQIKILRRTRDLFNQQINIKELCVSIYTQLYGKYFTTAELEDLIAFYRTPTGKKLIKTQPALSGEALRLTNEAIDSKIAAISQQVSAETVKGLSQFSAQSNGQGGDENAQAAGKPAEQGEKASPKTATQTSSKPTAKPASKPAK